MPEKDIQILLSLGYELDEKNNRIIEEGKYYYEFNDPLDRMELQLIIDNYQLQCEEPIEIVELIETKKVNTIKKERSHEILPTHSDIMRNTASKEYNTLGMIVCKSNFNNEGGKMEAYIYEKDLETKLSELKAEGIKVPSKSTLKRHIKALNKITIGDNSEKLITIESTPNGIVYKILQNYEGKYFVTIPCKQLKELLVGTNNNVLKLFCIFKYSCNETEWTPITRSYLVRHMGLTSNEASENYISIAIGVLKKLGYIKVKLEHLTVMDDNGKLIPNDKNYYQLTTYEEWLDITKNAGYVK